MARRKVQLRRAIEKQASLYVHTLLLFRLGLRVEFLHDGALAVPVLLTLEAVVDGGESDVRFGE
jgi:hypothetical protein